MKRAMHRRIDRALAKVNNVYGPRPETIKIKQLDACKVRKPDEPPPVGELPVLMNRAARRRWGWKDHRGFLEPSLSQRRRMRRLQRRVMVT